jgi:ACR3 family arsenite transporter
MSGQEKDGAAGGISFFNKFLSVWVLLCMAAGVLIGRFLPMVPAVLGRLQYAQVSIPIAVLIWLMIYPMMLKVDFQSVKNVGKQPKGLFVTWVTNWLIKPFTMFGFASLFFFVVFKSLIPAGLAKDYLAGAVLLGAAPCTAMVFVWSSLCNGNPAYTVVQVATNDLIILVAFTPIVALLLGVSGVAIPWSTLILSVVLFVVIPLAAGVITRHILVKRRGLDYFQNTFIPKWGNITTVGLLLTLVIIFSFQGQIILKNPLHIVLIAVPLVIQTFFIFFLAYGAAKLLKLPHDIAAPAGMIGASNFFELAVAVAISLFGPESPVALATTVGVLTEVPVMLILVKIANSTKRAFVMSDAYECIESVCAASKETDPLKLALSLMAKKQIRVNGPEHHFLIPAVLLTCYYNAKGQHEALTEKLAIAKGRAKKVPGGFCGNCGDCGAAVGTGIFTSIITGSDPFTEGDAWGLCNLMTSKSLAAIASYGGPRCCKRDSFTALLCATDFLKEKFNMALPVSAVHCPFSKKNEECKGTACPYFPG